MLPELFRIPFLNLPVHTYGALYVMGLLAGLFVAYRQALLGKKYQDDVLDFGFWVLLGALLGARALFIIVEWQFYFVDQPFTKTPLGFSIPTVLALWHGGFVFWGGVIGGIVALVIYCNKRNIPKALFFDICAPGLAIGHAFGRIGCVGGGCCYGYAAYHLGDKGQVIADYPFSLAFPKGSIAYNSLIDQASGKTLELMNQLGSTLPLFPVQLVEAMGNVLIFFILLFFIPLKRAHGQIVLIYLILYSLLRSFTETFRGDSIRGFVFDGLLSTSQFISVIIICLALGMIFLLGKNSKTLSNKLVS